MESPTPQTLHIRLFQQQRDSTTYWHLLTYQVTVGEAGMAGRFQGMYESESQIFQVEGTFDEARQSLEIAFLPHAPLVDSAAKTVFRITIDPQSHSGGR